MSDVVFILGAGASKQAGAPLMSNFLDEAESLLQMRSVDGREKEFEMVFEVIGNLQRVHSKAELDILNIESVFTVFELGKVINRLVNLDPKEIPVAIDSLKKLIVTTIEKKMMFPFDEYGQYHAPEPYGEFASLIDYLKNKADHKRSISVITFNYDMAADIALFRAGLQPNYRLYDLVEQLNSVDLLKLHGSLNWGVVNKSKVLPVDMARFLSSYRMRGVFRNRISGISISKHLKELLSTSEPDIADVDECSFIIPPSWNKANYHVAISNVWSNAALHLSEAKYIFIIGYSLPETDAFFRHLYALGTVSDKPLRAIQVFDPDQSVDKRFRDMLGSGAIKRYKFNQTTFEKSISMIRKLF